MFNLISFRNNDITVLLPGNDIYSSSYAFRHLRKLEADDREVPRKEIGLGLGRTAAA